MRKGFEVKRCDRFLLLLLFMTVVSLAQESFITQYEYGKMLYQNPRGIGCVNCHGEKGEGKIIANYVHKKKRKQLTAPSITNLSYAEFKKPFSGRKSSRSIMPTYHLTAMELQALYRYLTKQEKSAN